MQLIRKIFYKIWVIIIYLLIPLGIYLSFNAYLERSLNEYVLINSGAETTGKVVGYKIEKENVENDEMHETGLITHFICDIEFETKRHAVVKAKIDINKSDFQKLNTYGLQIVFIENNPNIFQIINLEPLFTKSEWFWKRFTLIIIFGFSIIVSVIFAFYKGYKFDYDA